MSTTTHSPDESCKHDVSQWGPEHYVVNSIRPLNGPRRPPPVFSKDDSVPVLNEWSCHVFILLHATWPVAFQQLYRLIGRGKELPLKAVALLYIFAFTNMMLREAKVLHKIGKRVGYLDGDAHPRDAVPHDGVRKTLFSVLFFAIVRPSAMLVAARCYASSSPSASSDLSRLSWYLPLELFLYPLVLDLWFYVYHRACHEVGVLWRYHRTHHLTKHPNPILASFSDFEQEIIEVILVPLATFFTLQTLARIPMTFPDWWICQAYILFQEIIGHSGLRIYAVAPAVCSPILRLLQCELVIEDHDLHHRNGWRQSNNYGKQTRLWDHVFGTVAPRIESTNVDPEFSVSMNCF